MNIEGFSQVLDRHYGTFDVPAGPAGTKRRLPERLAFFRSFPQSEIASVGFLIAIHIDPRAGDIAAEIVMGQLAIARKSRNPEINRAIAAIGMVAFAELLDGPHHVVNV